LSAIIIYFEHQDELKNLGLALEELEGWEFYYIKSESDSLQQIEKHMLEHQSDFLICTKRFSLEIAKQLSYLYSKYPLLTLIYFSAVLEETEFVQLYRSGIKYCYVGEKRWINLGRAFKKICEDYWKKIPPSLYNKDFESLTVRARRILRFIENTPFKHCDTEHIAAYLKISQSHFRREFKDYFNISFREFKQHLLHNYEDILLFEKRLKPGKIYQILNYKNLSAFSRSFKARHGESWQKLIRNTEHLPRI